MTVHPAFHADTGFAHLRLGRLPRRTDSRTLMLAHYIDRAALPPIPTSYSWDAKVPSWPMYGNDRLGDCTCAAAGHMVEVWSAAAGRFVMPTDSAVEAFYIPGTGTQDDGRNELDVLNAWRKVGFGGDTIVAYAEVKVAKTMVKTGIYLFGGLYTGVALPMSAQRQKTWDVVGDGKTGDSEPGSWGGHAVPFVGYDSTGVYLVTWGAVMKATWRFVSTYFDEAYAVIGRDFLAGGRSPLALDVAALEADLAQIDH